MNNEINECNINKKSEEIIKNETKSHFFKINIIKPIENEKISEIQTKKNNKNKLLLSPIQNKRRKSKNLDMEIKSILENSFREKKSIIIEPEKKEEKIEEKKDNIHLIKTMKEEDTIKSKSNKEEYTSFEKSISPIKKNDINNNINNNNNNDFSNIIQFNNKLYENDRHLNKLLISKKIEINVKNNTPNNQFFINLGSDKFNNNVNIIKENNGIDTSFKSKKINDNSPIKRLSVEYNKSKEKSIFSNYLNIKLKNSPKKERGDESNKINNNIDNNYNNKNYKTNKDGDITSKSNNNFMSKAKTLKSQILDLPDKKKIKKNISIKTSKSKTKKLDSLNSIKLHDDDILKKENTKNKNNSKNKNKIFCLFCCLNSAQNDSGDN